MPINRHIKFSQVRHRNSSKTWKNKMSGVPVFIIGNGPSLNDENLNLLFPFFTIGINRSFYAIDTTVLMWQDIELWYTDRKRIIKLSSIKVCRNISDPQNLFFHFKVHNGDYQVASYPHSLYGRGSTGPLAVQFAHTLGCSPIVLLGYDCQCRGSDTDFYGNNRYHKPHTMTNCLKGLAWVRETMSPLVDIINCSDNKIFDKREKLENVISNLGKKYKKSRPHWTGMLL